MVKHKMTCVPKYSQKILCGNHSLYKRQTCLKPEFFEVVSRWATPLNVEKLAVFLIFTIRSTPRLSQQV